MIMDEDNANILKMLDAAFNLRQVFVSIASSLQQKYSPSCVSRGFDIKRTDQGYVMECYVELELNEAVSFSWWLDIGLGRSGCNVEAVVFKDTARGQDIIIRVWEKADLDINVLPSVLKEVGEKLLKIANIFDPAIYN
jgi:hypothetical protein